MYTCTHTHIYILFILQYITRIYIYIKIQRNPSTAYLIPLLWMAPRYETWDPDMWPRRKDRCIPSAASAALAFSELRWR